MQKGQLARVLDSRAFHGAVLAAGVAFLLIGAFHGNVWFDESYSVGIAAHSFSEIWRIGAGDVHPVLFYWCLHALYLVFGTNVLVYRLFAVAGAAALAALGLTHVRPDYGPRAGVLFTALVCFAPYMAVISTEIRMYSWAAFCVTLCFLSALRVLRAVRRAAETGEALRIPARLWAALFASSLAAAYLHYFGALAAFAVNLVVLVGLIARIRTAKRPLAVFAAGCVAQVAAYLPWLATVAGQVAVVSNTYWANVVFPDTYIELATYPVIPSAMSFALRGSYGAAAQAASRAFVLLLAAAVATALIVAAVRFVRRVPAPLHLTDASRAVMAAFAVYVGVAALGFAASWAMGSFILYYRYLFVALGPFLVGCAIMLAAVRPRQAAGVAVAALVACASLNMALLVHDNYDPANQAPLTAFDQAVAWAQEGVQDERAEGDEAAASTDADTASATVLSSDIGVEGVTAVLRPGVSQVYLDWQPGNWALSYEAYAPTLASVKSWDEVLARCGGRFVVIGQTSDGSVPRDVADLAARDDVSCVDVQTFYRPYERTYFTIARMEKTAA